MTTDPRRCASCGYCAATNRELAVHGAEKGHSVHFGPVSGNWGAAKNSGVVAESDGRAPKVGKHVELLGLGE